MIQHVLKGWLASALCLAVYFASPANAETVNAPSAQVEGAALLALSQGDAPTAYALAQALVASNPDDPDTQIILARAALRLGRPEESRNAAKAVWRLTRSSKERYAAARLAARASIALGQSGATKRWLSRSLALAPTDRARAQLRADYAAVRAAAPTQANFSFTVAPSDNVNGGSTNSFFLIDRVPFVGQLSADAQALAGYEARLNYSLSHRVFESERHRTSLTFALNTRDVWLSSEAQEAAPDLDPKDLAYRRADIGIRNEWIDTANGLLWSATAEVGTIYSGSEFQDDTLSFGLRANAEFFSYGLDLERRFTRDPLDVEDTHVTVSLRHRRPLEFGTLSVGASFKEVMSDSIFAASSHLSIDGYLALREPLGPFRLAGFAGATRTHYPEYVSGGIAVPGGRTDITARLGAEASIPNFLISGFHPVLSLSAQRTDSNVSRFETEQIGLGLALRRSF